MDEIEEEDPDAPIPLKRPINTIPLFPLSQVWPDFPAKPKDLLTRSGEHYLSSTVDTLWIFERCRCGSDHCATAYTQPRPEKSYGPTHRNVAFWPPGSVSLDTGMTHEQENPGAVTTEHMIVLDVVRGSDGNEVIACIEALDDAELRDRLVAALPDDK